MDVRAVRRVALALAPLVILASAGAATGSPQQRAEPGPRFDLVSENNRGRIADESSVSPVTSQDGRLVAFTSYALNLDPRVRAGRNKQIYLWDAGTGRLRLALRRPNGAMLEDAEVPALSPNGRFLAFCSRDPKIVRPDSRASDALFWADQDVFVADLRSGEIRRASSDHRGAMADGYSCAPQVADTGDVVFFSFATDLVRGDDNEAADTFLWDWSSERVRRLTRVDDGNYAYDISADGSATALVTTEQLAGRDTNATGDLYVYERRGGGLGGEWKLALTRQDGSPPLTGVPYGGVTISRTGRFVTAQSADGGLATPAVADKTLHLWLRDRRTGRTTLLNRTSSEFSEVAEVHVSGDGRTVTYLGSGTHDYGGVRPEGTSTVELFAWRRGSGVESLTPGPDVWAAPSGSDLSGDGDWVTFTMVRDDVPGLNPLYEPARVVVYRTRVR